jgi:hypothetical protein
MPNEHLFDLFDGPGRLQRITYSRGNPDLTLKNAGQSFRTEAERLQAKAAKLRENLTALQANTSEGSRVAADEARWGIRHLEERAGMFEQKAEKAELGVLLIPRDEWGSGNWRAMYGPAFDELASSGRVAYGS